MTGELLLRLYVFALVAVSVAWAIEVLWLAVGRAVWRRLLQVARYVRQRAGPVARAEAELDDR